MSRTQYILYDHLYRKTSQWDIGKETQNELIDSILSDWVFDRVANVCAEY